MIVIKESHMDFCATMISCTWFVFWLCNPASASCAPPPPVFSSLRWSPVLCSFSSGMHSYEKVRGESTTQQEAQVFSSSSVWSVVQRFLIEGYFHPLRVNSLLCLDFSFIFFKQGQKPCKAFCQTAFRGRKITLSVCCAPHASQRTQGLATKWVLYEWTCRSWISRCRWYSNGLTDWSLYMLVFKDLTLMNSYISFNVCEVCTLC